MLISSAHRTLLNAFASSTDGARCKIPEQYGPGVNTLCCRFRARADALDSPGPTQAAHSWERNYKLIDRVRKSFSKVCTEPQSETAVRIRSMGSSAAREGQSRNAVCVICTDQVDEIGFVWRGCRKTASCNGNTGLLYCANCLKEQIIAWKGGSVQCHSCRKEVKLMRNTKLDDLFQEASSADSFSTAPVDEWKLARESSIAAAGVVGSDLISAKERMEKQLREDVALHSLRNPKELEERRKSDLQSELLAKQLAQEYADQDGSGGGAEAAESPVRVEHDTGAVLEPAGRSMNDSTAAEGGIGGSSRSEAGMLDEEEQQRKLLEEIEERKRQEQADMEAAQRLAESFGDVDQASAFREMEKRQKCKDQERQDALLAARLAGEK